MGDADRAMGINNAIFEFCMKHSDDPQNRTEGIPERDASDYDWLKGALAQIKTDGERMETALKIVRESEDNGAVVCALEEILYFVEDLDNAIDFFKVSKGKNEPGMNASADILRLTERRDAPEVRDTALQIISACTQNNPLCQMIVAAGQGLEVLLRQLEVKEHVNKTLVGAISAMTRGQLPIEDRFHSLQGPEKLVDAIVAHKEDARLCKKALFFLASLWTNRQDGATPLPNPPLSPAAASVLCEFLRSEDCDLRELTSGYLVVAAKGEAVALLKEAGVVDALAAVPSEIDGLEAEVHGKLRKALGL
eukprot:Hpha_TRINITY_DN13567_c1_g1::TRINITY_DN13567_c1_g1_i1::g.111761::m.111761/K09562/HSPBP1; hsp70-interacting protein